MKILMMSDSWHTVSGFGTASRHLAEYLSRVGHDVHYIGWQTYGQEVIPSFHKELYHFYGLPNVGGERFGEKAWKYWLPRVKPDLVLTLCDFWMVVDLFRQNDLPYPWMMWYPIDGVPITDQMELMLKKLDYRVCISEWGAEMVRKLGLETEGIPHGTDPSIYKPYHPKIVSEMKNRLGIPANSFVVGRVDRNQTRKNIPDLIKAFIPLKKDFPESVLYLHMDKRDPEGWDLEYIVKRFGLKEGRDVFFPPPDMVANFMYGTPAEELAQVMNTFDVHGWTTGGEGFGLTGLETMACGTVNVATDYTTPHEIFDNWKCGLPIKVRDFSVGNAGVDRANIDIDDCYGKLKWIRENPDERKAMSDRGVKRAKEVYDWKLIARRFDDYIRKVI